MAPWHRLRSPRRRGAGPRAVQARITYEEDEEVESISIVMCRRVRDGDTVPSIVTSESTQVKHEPAPTGQEQESRALPIRAQASCTVSAGGSAGRILQVHDSVATAATDMDDMAPVAADNAGRGSIDGETLTSSMSQRLCGENTVAYLRS